ncbi:MAG: hypothetical protein H6656_21155 [Ardenticatenaceae bacterium]|nr:hypothetical protein [Ardenticatenaceae bacterium]
MSLPSTGRRADWRRFTAAGANRLGAVSGLPDAAADCARKRHPQPPDEYDTITAPDSPTENIRISSPAPFAYVQGAGGDYRQRRERQFCFLPAGLF